MVIHNKKLYFCVASAVSVADAAFISGIMNCICSREKENAPCSLIRIRYAFSFGKQVFTDVKVYSFICRSFGFMHRKRRYYAERTAAEQKQFVFDKNFSFARQQKVKFIIIVKLRIRHIERLRLVTAFDFKKFHSDTSIYQLSLLVKHYGAIYVISMY